MPSSMSASLVQPNMNVRQELPDKPEKLELPDSFVKLEQLNKCVRVMHWNMSDVRMMLKIP